MNFAIMQLDLKCFATIVRWVLQVPIMEIIKMHIPLSRQHFIGAAIIYCTNVLRCGLKLAKQCLMFFFLSLSCAVSSFVLPMLVQVRPHPLTLMLLAHNGPGLFPKPHLLTPTQHYHTSKDHLIHRSRRWIIFWKQVLFWYSSSYLVIFLKL